jgi:hypothetical protein
MSKQIFIRYSYFKGYVIYGEHSDEGMTEIESHDINFLEKDFLNIGEVKNESIL